MLLYIRYIVSLYIILSVYCIKYSFDNMLLEETLNEKSMMNGPDLNVAKQYDVDLNKPPQKNNNSIWIAMKMYNIELPKNTKKPYFSEDTTDRATTTFSDNIYEAISKEAIEVKIGPSAFTSWAILGSTIAHEVEIHCNQSPLLIIAQDYLNLNGTANAERKAYIHEILHADRFGLKTIELLEIKATLQIYYGQNN